MLSKRNTSDTSQTVQRGLCTQHLALFSKNQLAKENLDSVAPVVIPSRALTLDHSHKSDRSCVCSEYCAFGTGSQTEQ